MNREQLNKFIRATVKAYNDEHGTDIDYRVLENMAQAESNGDNGAVSQAGARGIFQLMPATAAKHNIDPNDPIQNIIGGIAEFGEMYSRYNGDYKLALAAYNAGPGNVDKYGGIPPFKETQNYVNKVLANIDRGDTLETNRSISFDEKAQKALSKVPPDVLSADPFFKGFIVGLGKGELSQEMADQYGVDLNDPRAKIGFGLAKTGKFAGEYAASEAILRVGLPLLGSTLGPLGTATGVALSNSATGIKLAKLGAKLATKVPKVIPGTNAPITMAGDAATGLVTGGLSNLGVNVAGAGAADILSGGKAYNEEIKKQEAKNIGAEAGFSGAISGALNVPLAAWTRGAANRFAAQATVDDLDALITETGKEIGDKAKAGTKAAKKIFDTLAEARYNEITPIEKGMDAVSVSLQSSKEILPFDDFYPIIKQVEKATGGAGGSLVASDPNVRVIMDAFGMTDKFKNLKGVPLKEIRKLDDAIDGLLETAKTKDNTALRDLAGNLNRMRAREIVQKNFPDELKKLNEQYANVLVKYGDPSEPAYTKLNEYYKTFDPKTKATKIGESDAVDALTATGEKSHQVHRKIGEFVDSGVVSPVDVNDVFMSKAARKTSSGASRWRKTVGPGRAENLTSKLIMDDKGVSFQKFMDDRAKEALKKTPKVDESLTQKLFEEVPSPSSVGNRFLADRTQQAYRESMGGLGQQLADNQVAFVQQRKALSDLRQPAMSTKSKSKQLFNIDESRTLPQFAAQMGAVAGDSQKAAAQNLNFSKFNQVMLPLGGRELLEEAYGMANRKSGTGMGPLNLGWSILSGGSR